MLGNSISFFYQNNGEMESFSEVCRFLCSKLNIRRLADLHIFTARKFQAGIQAVLLK